MSKKQYAYARFAKQAVKELLCLKTKETIDTYITRINECNGDDRAISRIMAEVREAM